MEQKSTEKESTSCTVHRAPCTVYPEKSVGFFALTIGRQLGSGGKLIGELLSQQLGIPCYDKELIQLASIESGLEKEFFEKIDEKNTFNMLGGIFSFRSGMSGDNSFNYLCNETLFKIQSDVIQKIAAKESCIFVGRCADYILRNHPRCISIFISADTPSRIHRIATDNQITEKEAKTRIEQTDKKRSSYYNYYSNKQWGMSTSYDLCINSSVLGIEETAKFIFEYISRGFAAKS